MRNEYNHDSYHLGRLRYYIQKVAIFSWFNWQIKIKTKREDEEAVGENPGTIFLDFEEDFEYCVSQIIWRCVVNFRTYFMH